MIFKVLNRIPDKFKKFDTWVFALKRIIYIIGFVCLCIIDQKIGSVTGYIQYGIKNYTGIIIGIFILTAFKLNDFFKLPYLIWIVFFFIARYLSLDWLKTIIYNDMELETNIWGVGLYGIIFIRMIYLYVVQKKKPRMNWIPFIVCLIMLIGMVIIRSDYSWPKALCGAFLCFYLTDFKEKDLNNLYSGMAEGIIIGFMIVQTQAWMYRPYDYIRYKGMFSHPNMNALFYLYVYCAVLCKWYLMKLKKRNVLLRVPFIALAGLIIGTMFYTGGRAAFITFVVVTLVFLIFQMSSRRRWKIVDFLWDGTLLVVSIAVCVLPSYWLIRYVPVYVNEPLYFETDYAEGIEKKVQKNDSIYSEKYVELGEAADEMFERYFWFLDEETYANVVHWIRNFPQSLIAPLEVDAAEMSEGNDEEIYANWWDGVDNNIKKYIEPRTGKINDAKSSYRVSNPIFIQDMCCVIVSSDVAFLSNVGWRFLDEEGNIVAYGAYVQDEKEQIFVIPEEAKYFQFTWKPSIDKNLKVEFTNIRPENANVYVIEPGMDNEHPLVINDNQEGAYNVRLDIYKYFLDKLTLIGEKNNVQGVWLNKKYLATHCHNVFLQIAYDFGIIIGIMFILIVLIFYVRVIISLIQRRSGSWYYRSFVATMYVTLFVVFGMFELDWVYGQLPFTMFFLMQYVVYHRAPERILSPIDDEEALGVAQLNIEVVTAELPELEIEEL